MPNIQVKDVPPEVHAALRERAAAAHQSLQEYVLGLLVSAAGRPTLDEVLDRIARRPRTSVTPAQAAAAVRAGRAGR